MSRLCDFFEENVNEELRKQVAERVYSVFGAGKDLSLDATIYTAAHKDFQKPDGTTDPIDRAWLRIADEVIRQMEWARRHTITPGWTMDISVPEFPRKIVFNELNELSLAPKDWTP